MLNLLITNLLSLDLEIKDYLSKVEANCLLYQSIDILNNKKLSEKIFLLLMNHCKFLFFL